MDNNPNWHDITADAVDEEWLSAIGKRWQVLTGRPWNTWDGETRQERLDANVQALFDVLERDVKTLVEALRHIAEYPVHSEPVGSALDMQRIATEALDNAKSVT